MPRKRKTTSAALTEAGQKIAGMKSIEEDLDLGNDLTVAKGELLVTNSRTILERYNASLAVSDGLLNEFNQSEKILRAFNRKVLPAGGLKFGTDSDEYEKLGGIRDSERKKPTRKPKAAQT